MVAEGIQHQHNHSRTRRRVPETADTEPGCKWHFSKCSTCPGHHFPTLPKALSSSSRDGPGQNTLKQPWPVVQPSFPSRDTFCSANTLTSKKQKQLLRFLINNSHRTKCSLCCIPNPKETCDVGGQVISFGWLCYENRMLYFPLYRIHLVLIKYCWFLLADSAGKLFSQSF